MNIASIGVVYVSRHQSVSGASVAPWQGVFRVFRVWGFKGLRNPRAPHIRYPQALSLHGWRFYTARILEGFRVFRDWDLRVAISSRQSRGHSWKICARELATVVFVKVKLTRMSH